MDEKFGRKDYFTIQRRMLTLGGISLQGNESFPYKIYAMAFRISLVVYFLILVEDVVINLDDLDVIIDSVYHIIAIVIALSKNWMISFNSNKLDKTLKLLQQGVFAPNKKRGGPVEEKWIKECVTNSNRLIIASWTLALITLSLAIIACIIKRIINEDSRHWQLPFGKFSFVNPNHSPNFELSWFYQSVMFLLLAVDYLGTDLLIVSVFTHICVQFRMLCNSIRRIVGTGLDIVDQNTKGSCTYYKERQELKTVETTWECLSQKLKQNVSYHVAIIDIAEQFEDIMNLLILTNYVSIMVALGCIMYHGSLYSVLDSRFQKDAMMGTACSFQLFLVSYFANEVKLESQMVVSACFEEKFFQLDIRLQKGLKLIMARSLKPTKFTVGKFVDLSLISFVGVVRASFSYYMVLHSMNQQSK